MAARRPALVIPDEQSWIAWGVDPAGEGLEPVLEAGRATDALLPDRVPAALAGAAAGALHDLPFAARGSRQTPLTGGVAIDELPGPGARQAAEHVHHHEGGGHDEMMAITGTPSADGLVMEPIELTLGPLGTPLPGGLAADLVLDGDVVAECTVRATLRRSHGEPDDPPQPPDLLAPVTWTAAISAAAERAAGVDLEPAMRWRRLAGLEIERATSHVAWLRAFGRLLGWPQLVERAIAVATPLLAARSALGGPGEGRLDETLEAAATGWRVIQTTCASRRLAVRTAGRGVAIGEQGLRGPAGRAAGHAGDARMDDPLYGDLGFAPAGRDGGDARARTLVRVEEAGTAIALARAAWQRVLAKAPAPAMSVPPEVTLEGPRGPLQARREPNGWTLAAPAQSAALTAAGQAAVGLEWASALTVLASFDLSPWSVGA